MPFLRRARAFQPADPNDIPSIINTRICIYEYFTLHPVSKDILSRSLLSGAINPFRRTRGVSHVLAVLVPGFASGNVG
jgi:hypothetical protein